MASNWLLLRCKCGRSFGARQGTKSSCSRCGESSQITTTAVFTDPNQLTEAVANANLPSEISQEIENKLNEKKRKQLKTRNITNAGTIQRILSQSTEKRGVLTVTAEQQPCCVQVVEWVGLVTSSFQFFTRLAAVFAEEVSGFGFVINHG